MQEKPAVRNLFKELDASDMNTNELTCSCGKKLAERALVFEGFAVKGWKCKSCGEELVDPWAVEAVREMKSI
jgi:hypothetical protein